MNEIPYSGAVVYDSSPDEVAKLTEKWQKVEKTGQKIFKFGKNGVIITLLSPFDFEGPIAEIATAVIAAVGFLMKTIAKAKLKDINGGEEPVLNQDEFKQTVDGFFDIGHKTMK